MRHFFSVYTRSIYALPCGVADGTLKSVLIAPSSLSDAPAPALGGTLRRTIDIAPVTRKAKAHLGAAQRTIKQTKARIAQSFSQATGQEGLDRRHSTRRRSIDDSGDSRYQLGSLSLLARNTLSDGSCQNNRADGYTFGEVTHCEHFTRLCALFHPARQYSEYDKNVEGTKVPTRDFYVACTGFHVSGKQPQETPEESSAA